LLPLPCRTFLSAPRFWVPRDQPKPGYFLEGGRERTLGTRLVFCGNKFLVNLNFRLYHWEQIFVEKLPIWAGRNRQSTTFCCLAGNGLVRSCYQIYSETAETIHYVPIVKRKVIILFSQSN